MPLHLRDVQGLVFHAYRRHPHARYVLLRFRHNRRAVQEWLRALVDSGTIDSATPKEVGRKSLPGIRLNVAFTVSGLEALGLEPDALQTFPSAFVEGLGKPWRREDTPDHRSRILGDVGESAPATWQWGYQDGSRDVDALLLAFGSTAEAVNREVASWIGLAEAWGVIRPGSARVLHGTFPEDIKEPVREPFGFVDGVSQPVLKSGGTQLRLGERRTQPERHELEDGEILLGQRDGARQFTASPSVAAGFGATVGFGDEHELPTEHDYDDTKGRDKRHDLGRNGTYLVFRQLEQDVEGFNRACRRASQAMGIEVDRLKALMVGRWPNRSPLIRCPVAADDSLNEPPAANDFTYGDDPLGEHCPIGSHIRRANPRDSLVEDRDESWRVSNRHRILRRGRPYSMNGHRGIHFIALNADIVRQFEFIQQNWINNPAFGGLPAEVDPIMGTTAPRGDGGMTLPPSPQNRIARRAEGLAGYVTVRGGGYFFLPGMTTLRYLAGGPAPVPRPEEVKPVPRPPSKADAVRVVALMRFSLLIAGLLAILPLSLGTKSASLVALVAPMFLVGRPWELALVTMIASLTAEVAMVTARLVQLYAKARFGLSVQWSKDVTWGRVLRWQALSLPWVGATFWLSVRDAALNTDRFWPVLGSYGFAVVGGYAISFAVMYLAEAARQRGVRDKAAAEMVILPESRRLERLRRFNPEMMALAKPLARFFEKRAAMWPPDRGRGYIDHATGQVLPGHLSSLTLFLIALLVFVAGRWLLNPESLWLGIQLPPAAYLLFLLMVGGWALTSAAFFLDRYRVPLLTLIVLWLAVASTFRDADHQFQVNYIQTAPNARPTPPPALTPADVIARADGFTRARGADPTTRPIIVVAAGGGGAFQAAWTARVLTGLTERWGASFSGNLRLVSAVSAGAVGSMHFLDAYTADGPPSGDQRKVLAASMAAATGDLWWGLAYFDVPRMLLPLRIERDRGWALEQAWRRAMRAARDGRPARAAPTMTSWKEGVAAGWRPASAFNAMAVETGERVVLATYALPGTPRQPAQTTPGSTLPPPIELGTLTNNRDIDVVTAARLSASFPYITPFARAAGKDSRMLHIADGGYWDNYAIVSTLEWLTATEETTSTRDVVVIHILPPVGADEAPRDRAWVWQFLAPLRALESMRTNAQRARSTLDLERYRQTRNHNLTVIEFASGEVESLSWHLSREERCRIETTWRGNQVASQLEALAGILGRSRNVASELPAECRR